MKNHWFNAQKAGMPAQKFLLALFICMVFSYGNSLYAQQKKSPAAAGVQTSAPIFTHKIINGANGTFGYDIYAYNKLRIHQPAIPAMPGNDGFRTKAAAEKVALLAIAKMKKGESLPTISPGELKKLNVL